MICPFEVVYELDTTLGCAVAAYLDAEHYAFLHSKYSPRYEVLEHHGRFIRARQTWHFNGLWVGQVCTTEYIPPARFINSQISGFPAWLPSIHGLIRTTTDLSYYPDSTGTRTISHLRVNLEGSALLRPLFPIIEASMTRLKRAKDLEDMDMIERREKLFGRGNLTGYLRRDQFLLHKQDFVEHFGSSSAEKRAAELALASAPVDAQQRVPPLVRPSGAARAHA